MSNIMPPRKQNKYTETALSRLCRVLRRGVCGKASSNGAPSRFRAGFTLVEAIVVFSLTILLISLVAVLLGSAAQTYYAINNHTRAAAVCDTLLGLLENELHMAYGFGNDPTSRIIYIDRTNANQNEIYFQESGGNPVRIYIDNGKLMLHYYASDVDWSYGDSFYYGYNVHSLVIDTVPSNQSVLKFTLTLLKADYEFSSVGYVECINYNGAFTEGIPS